MTRECEVYLRAVSGSFLGFVQLVDRPIKEADDRKLVRTFDACKLFYAGRFGDDIDDA